MRVIAGRFRSRRLKSVEGSSVRPTPDRLRESLFNILTPHIEGCVFLDAYAGSGAVGIEALSRGARQIILLEKSALALAVIRENLAALQATREAIVVRGNAASLMRDLKSDITFIDPPYEHTGEYGEALLASAQAGCPLVIAQHPSKFALEERYADLARYRIVRQGDNSLSFYRSGNQDNLDVHNIGAGGTGLD